MGFNGTMSEHKSFLLKKHVTGGIKNEFLTAESGPRAQAKNMFGILNGILTDETPADKLERLVNLDLGNGTIRIHWLFFV